MSSLIVQCFLLPNKKYSYTKVFLIIIEISINISIKYYFQGILMMSLGGFDYCLPTPLDLCLKVLTMHGNDTNVFLIQQLYA